MTKVFKFFITAPGHILILLFLGTPTISQSTSKITYGDLQKNRVSVEEFKKQNQLKPQAGIFIDSAFTYFSIPGEAYILSVKYFPDFDSIRFYKYSDILTPGATVSFKIFVTDQGHKCDTMYLSYVFYSMIKQNVIFSALPNPVLIMLPDSNYLSGTIYFSGANFSNVITFNIQNDKRAILKQLLDRCGPGSIITFDNVYYKNDKGILLKRNDSIKF